MLRMNQSMSLLLEEYYERVCGPDEECGQLKEVMMRVFRTDDDSEPFMEETMSPVDQFEWVYPLVYRVSNRLDGIAVHSVWVNCCQSVVARWAEAIPLHCADKDISLLPYLLQCWTRYQSALNLVHSLTIYAQNRLSIVRKDINQIFCDIFVEHFLESPKLRGEVFKEIVATMERNKEFEQDKEVHVETIQSVLQLLSYLDHRHQTVFYRVFGMPYLKMLQESTLGDAPNMEKSSEVISYLKEVESEIDQQVTEANLYRFPSALVKMVGKLSYSQLVARHREAICRYEIFVKMVQSNIGQLGYLFRMISYDPDGVKLMACNVQRYLQTQLSSIVSLKSDEPCSPEQMHHFLGALIDLRQKWLVEMACQAFIYDCTVHQSMVQAFAQYLNSESVHVCALAVFVHLASLAQAPLNLLELPPDNYRKMSIDQAGKLLSLVEDKQVLVEYIRFFLCDRILRQVSFEPEADFAQTARLLNFLQIESPFSVNLMLKDYKAGLFELDNQMLHRHVESFQVRAVNGSFWKLDSDSITQKYRLPKSFWSMFNSFRGQFMQKNTKKSIHLNRNYGSAQLVAHFDSFRIKYQFVTSLRQAVILTVFNKHPNLTFARLKSIIKMDDESLQQCLRVFLKYRLVCVGSDQDDCEQVDLSVCSFSINDKFDHNKLESTDSVLVTTDQLVQVNWIKLQYECCVNFNLGKIIQTVTNATDSEEDINKPDSAPNCTKPVVTKAKPVENNQNDQTVRIEAMVVRVLKRAKIVPNMKTLHSLTVDALAKTTWASRLSPRQNTQLVTNGFSMSDLNKIVNSLEKNGYLKCMPTGEIVYEP